MRTVGDDNVVKVVALYNGHLFPQRWYYNLSEREAIKRYKAVYKLTGKHNVQVGVS